MHPSISAMLALAYKLDRVLFAEAAGFRDLDPWQRRALRSTAARMLLLASRQSGKSATVALISAHTALYQPSSETLIIAPTERQSKETFAKVMGAFHALRWPVPSDAESTLYVQLRNGSRVLALPGSAQTIRGYRADLLLLDEAAQISDELLQSVFPSLTVARAGRLLALSTPFGRRGWFFDAWESGRDADTELPWERYFVPASDCPRISQAVIREALRLFGPAYVASEYNCEFSDAAGSLFNAADVQASLKEYSGWDLRPFMAG
jgi:hypothetical protein